MFNFYTIPSILRMAISCVKLSILVNRFLFVKQSES